ncbi:hypothetical protein M1545_02890, partial [Patescibacteria group bacterium]|nr:hypothetical protein [Patescibacteria group bacterium]
MDDLKQRAQEAIAKLDLKEKQEKIQKIEAESASPAFWQNPQEGSKKMQELSELQKEASDVIKLQDLLASDHLEEAEELLGKLEVTAFLSGSHDASDA